MFETQTFGAVNNSALIPSRDFMRKCQNGDVFLVGGMPTITDIVDSVPHSDDELVRFTVSFRLVVFIRQPSLPYMQCQLEANTSGRDTVLSYRTQSGGTFLQL